MEDYNRTMLNIAIPLTIINFLGTLIAVFTANFCLKFFPYQDEEENIEEESSGSSDELEEEEEDKIPEINTETLEPELPNAKKTRLEDEDEASTKRMVDKINQINQSNKSDKSNQNITDAQRELAGDDEVSAKVIAERMTKFAAAFSQHLSADKKNDHIVKLLDSVPDIVSQILEDDN